MFSAFLVPLVQTYGGLNPMPLPLQHYISTRFRRSLLPSHQRSPSTWCLAGSTLSPEIELGGNSEETGALGHLLRRRTQSSLRLHLSGSHPLRPLGNAVHSANPSRRTMCFSRVGEENSRGLQNRQREKGEKTRRDEHGGSTARPVVPWSYAWFT